MARQKISLRKSRGRYVYRKSVLTGEIEKKCPCCGGWLPLLLEFYRLSGAVEMQKMSFGGSRGKSSEEQAREAENPFAALSNAWRG